MIHDNGQGGASERLTQGRRTSALPETSGHDRDQQQTLLKELARIHRGGRRAL